MAAPNQQASLSRTIGKPALEGAGNGKQVERLPGAHLQVDLGSALALRINGVEQRYEGKVVGLEPYSYIIVQSRLPQEVQSRLGMNPGVVVQLHTEGALYGFRTDVVNRVASPAPILFLSFPASVERVVLRRDERLSVSLPANIHGVYGNHEVVVIDLTPSGCRMSAKIDLKSPLRTAKSGDRVIMTCDLGRGQVLTAPLVLRRLEENRGKLNIGAQFVDLTEETAKLVEGYVQKMQRFMGE